MTQANAETSPAGLFGDDDFLRVERRGLEPVPDKKRHGHPRELFWIWAAALADFFSILAGALLVQTVGLGVGDAILVLLAGALAGALLLGPMSVTGVRSGLPQIVYSRLAFGRRGAYVGGLLTLLIAIGWFSYDCAIAVYTAQALPVFGGGAPAPVIALMLVAMVAGCIAVAVFGHRTITIVQTVQAPAFMALCVVVFAVLLPRFHPGLRSQLHGWPHLAAMLLGFTATFALIVSWVTYAADYSRYLPRRTAALPVGLYSGLGSIATLAGCGILGVLVQSIDPRADLAHLIVGGLPVWLAWVFVAFIVVAEMSSNYLNVYTAALSGLAIGLPMRRWLAALVVGLLGGAFAAWILVRFEQTGGNFVVDYLNFLTVTYVWFPAWCVIVLLDFWRRRQATTWGWVEGVRWPALAAFALGTLATLAFYNQRGTGGPFTGLGSSALFKDGVADVSGFVGVAATVALALVLTRPGAGQAGAAASMDPAA